MSTLRTEMLAFAADHRGLSLAEAQNEWSALVDMPDEAFAMAEQIAGPGADLTARMKAFIRVGQQLVKMAEGGGDGELVRLLRSAMDPRGQAAGGASGPESEPTALEVRPDIQLAKLANEIRVAEDVDYRTAIRLAQERDPGLARRYADEVCDTSRRPQLPNRGAPPADRPDVELGERARARAKATGCDYRLAVGLVLSEDRALAARYEAQAAAAGAGGAHFTIKAPPGQRLVTRRSDIELAERARERAETEGIGLAPAAALVLAEDEPLASRYRDFAAGRTALEEASYRAEQVRSVTRGRLSREKALSAALAEDPQLRRGVAAYFERDE